MTSRKKGLYARHIRAFLETFRPDLVHFQHTLFFGYDIILQTRNTLPHAPIVYTLHEYLPICHRNGQLLRTKSEEPCLEASPLRCHTCFPEISPASFFLRQRFIRSHLSFVDLFLAPSRFLLERFVDWGIPREKIRYEEYGRLPVSRLAEQRTNSGRNRLGFFGQLNFFKGINVLLEAMRRLGEEEPHATRSMREAADAPKPRASDPGPPPHLWVHGANLELSPPEFQDTFRELLEATKANVTFVGRYERTRLPQLMANVDWVVVPSIWWENSPLIIQEAFMHGRPVICSDLGSMAEKVEHGVNGLHFRANDPGSLAETIRYATSSPDLWERLRQGIPEVYRMQDHVSGLDRIYHDLLGR
jgi:glycosyltransferase involved in cell wall biosynthesis